MDIVKGKGRDIHTFSRYCDAKCVLYFCVMLIEDEYSGEAWKNSVALAARWE